MRIREILSRFFFAATLCVAFLLARPAAADGVADEADLQFELGAIAYRDSKFVDALEHFLASNRLVPNTNVMFNIARAYEQLKRYPDAFRYYTDALRGTVGDSDDAKRTRTELEEAINRVSPQVAIIQVDSTPKGATIYLNRKDLGSIGTTPINLGLAAGKYNIIVEAPGYEPTTLGPFTVSQGSQTPAKADLRLIVGTAVFETEPGVAVRVDNEADEPSCVTPCSLKLRPGPHTFFFAKESFAAPSRVVVIEANKSLTIPVSLAPVSGSLLVNASEPNAAVYVDDKVVGYVPTVINNLPTGNRRVRVELRGYAPFTQTVEIKPNTQTDLSNVLLEPLRQVSAASRAAESIEDAPASVSIISAAEMDAFAYPTILEALRGTRGIATSYDSVYGNASIRGLGQTNDYNNRILVLSDGATLNENVLYQPFVHYDGRTDLGDVERIEIVRGPGSVLYGTGAVSGVVNLVPKAIEKGTEVQVSTYENSIARARARIGHIFDNGAAVALSLSGARGGGRDEVLETDDGPVGVSRYDAFLSGTANLRATYKDLTLQAFYTRRKNRVPTGNFGNVPGDTRNWAIDSRFMSELRYEPKLGKDTKLLTRAYLNSAYYRMNYHFDAGYDNLYNEDYQSLWAGVEARIIHQLPNNLQLSVGTELVSHFKVAMDAQSSLPDGSFEDIFEIRAPYRVYAGYALADWRPSKKMRLQLGGRVDRWDLSQDQKGATTNQAVAEDFTSFSPRLALIATPTKQDVVKIMGGRAFRAPSIYEYFYDDRGLTQASSDCCGTSLSPETVYSGEIEYTRRLNRDWSALGSVYATLAQNIIETVPVPDDIRDANGWSEGVAYYKSSSVNQTMVGADLEVRREFRGGKLFSAQYGLIRAQYSEPQGSEGDLSSDLPNSPTQYFSLRGVMPIVPELANAAMRLSFDDARRINTATSEKSRRGVIADFVISGRAARHNFRYNVGVYNMFNWKLSQGGEPYASPVLPQLGRSFMMSLTLER